MIKICGKFYIVMTLSISEEYSRSKNAQRDSYSKLLTVVNNRVLLLERQFYQC